MQVSKRGVKTTLKVSRDPTWFRLYEIRGRLQKKKGCSLTFDRVISELIDSYLETEKGKGEVVNDSR